MEPLQIKVKKLDERAVIPQYAHVGDVGMDLTAIDVEYDVEKDLYIYKTGLSFESPYGYGQLLFPRSSNRKTDAYLCNSVGIADSAIYRGEILLCFKLRDSLQSMITNEALKRGFDGTKEGWDIVLADTANEFKERAKNLEFAPYKVGDRVAQMVFIPYPTVFLEETDTLSNTVRQDGGFGSTGN